MPIFETINSVKYRKDLYIGTPKPLVKDDNGNVLEYIVDTFCDHHVGNDYYREYIRFKVSKSNIEVYSGYMAGGLAFEKHNILTVLDNIVFDEQFVKDRVQDWYEQKRFEEETVKC